MRRNPYRKDQVEKDSKIEELPLHNMEVAEDMLADSVEEKRRDDHEIAKIRKKRKKANDVSNHPTANDRE